jgi:hypothetical protein
LNFHLPNYKEVNLCYFKVLYLWYFVTAATGN